MYYIYIVKCQDQTLYTGSTNDLDKRIMAHNQKKGAKYTRSRLPVVLLYSEAFASKQEALKREYQIKKMNRQAKLALMAEDKQR